MPTYSYRCTECGNAFDVQQSFTDDSLTVCPSCSGVLRKVFSAIGVSFTGSGFYRNDSRAAADKSKGGSESLSPDSGSEKSSEKASSTPAATDSKPAVSTPKKSESSSTVSSGGAKNVKSTPTT